MELNIQENEAINKVAEIAQKTGIESYVIGGFVRDLALKKASKDIDFVCRGSGIALAEAVGKSIGSKVTVYRKFGTAMLMYKDHQLEFVGARKESYRSESRKPIVEDGTIEDDQKRRDFTINAMAININKENFGQLTDPFNGIADLKKKQVRTPLPPDITFSEDPLRMMRAIRFASQLNFDIDPDTFQAIKNNKGRMEIVSQERTTDELNKIILSEKPSYGFKLLFHSGLLHEVFPRLVALHGVEKREGLSHKDNFYHTLQVLDNISGVTNDLWLRWAALLHDIAKPDTKRFVKGHGWTFHGHEDKGARLVPGIFRGLKLPLGKQMHYVQKLVRLHLRPIALVKEEITDSAVRRLLYEAGDNIEDLMKLCKADITSKIDVKVKKYLTNFAKVEKKMREVEENDRVRNFQPPVTGEEIMAHFNLSPCKLVGEIKDEIKEAIMEGKIGNNQEEATQLMWEIGKRKGLARP